MVYMWILKGIYLELWKTLVYLSDIPIRLEVYPQPRKILSVNL